MSQLRKRNRISCAKCGEIIESTFRHDFKYCSCGAICVDGGTSYCRYGGNLEDIIIIEDDGSERPLEVILEGMNDAIVPPPEAHASPIAPVTDDEIFDDIEKLHEQIEDKDNEIRRLKERVIELERGI